MRSGQSRLAAKRYSWETGKFPDRISAWISGESFKSEVVRCSVIVDFTMISTIVNTVLTISSESVSGLRVCFCQIAHYPIHIISFYRMFRLYKSEYSFGLIHGVQIITLKVFYQLIRENLILFCYTTHWYYRNEFMSQPGKLFRLMSPAPIRVMQ